MGERSRSSEQQDRAPLIGRSRTAHFPAARWHLRDATATIHARLHTHPSLASLASSRIGRQAYAALLLRLYGFHAPLEQNLACAGRASEFGSAVSPRSRVRLLWKDLRDLDVTAEAIAAAPRIAQTALPPLDCPGRLLGCIYVCAGSTLGGRVLARALDPLFGPSETAGRRFFTGFEDDAEHWRNCCATIEEVAQAGHLPDMVASATETFTAFEQWLSAD